MKLAFHNIEIFSYCFSTSINIGEAVRDFLLQADDEDRVTYGVYACAKYLER